MKLQNAVSNLILKLLNYLANIAPGGLVIRLPGVITGKPLSLMELLISTVRNALHVRSDPLRIIRTARSMKRNVKTE
jgi:hypothetical protein